MRLQSNNVNHEPLFSKERRGFVTMDPLLLMTFSFLFSCEYEESKLKLITVVLGTAVNHRRHCNQGDVKNGSPYGILLLARVLAAH